MPLEWKFVYLLTVLGLLYDDMGIAERKIRQKEEVKSSILRAAWLIVEQEGWQALSIRKIADAIEYSAPVIYDHFANKEAITLEFTKDGFRKLNEELIQATVTSFDPEKQIEAMAHAYWNFAFSNKEYYQIMYGLGMPTCETVQQIPELQTFSELFISRIKEIIARSADPSQDYFLKFHSVWSMLHGLISINMMGNNNNDSSKHGALSLSVLKDLIAGFINNIKA